MYVCVCEFLCVRVFSEGGKGPQNCGTLPNELKETSNEQQIRRVLAQGVPPAAEVRMTAIKT